MTNPCNTEVRTVIECLIHNGCHYNLEELDELYHPDLKIIIINETGQILTFNRQENMDFFAAKKASGAPPLDTSVEFNYIEANSITAYAIVTRYMNMGYRPEKIIFSLELKKTSGTWQIYRETAFAQPA